MSSSPLINKQQGPLPADLALLPRDTLKCKVVAEVHLLEEAGVVLVNPLERRILDHVLPAGNDDKVMERTHAVQCVKGSCVSKRKVQEPRVPPSEH